MDTDTVEQQAFALVSTHGGIRAAVRASGIPYTTLQARYHRWLEMIEPQRITIHVPRPRKTWAILCDEHEPYADDEVVGLVEEYIAGKDIAGLCIAGDWADFYGISFFRNDPTRMRWPDEIEYVRTRVKRRAEKFQNARRVYLSGNHEERLKGHLQSKARDLYGLEAFTVPELLHLARYDWEWVDNSVRLCHGQPPFRIGRLNVLHGHEVRVTSSAVNLARLYYLKCQENLMLGHHHQSQEYIQRKLNGKYEGCWTIGCLCETTAEYMPVTNWVNGFALVYVDDDGDFAVRQHKVIGGKIL